MILVLFKGSTKIRMQWHLFWQVEFDTNMFRPIVRYKDIFLQLGLEICGNRNNRNRALIVIFWYVCSAKFGRKVQYVNYIDELKDDLDVKQLPIPKQVEEWVLFDLCINHNFAKRREKTGKGNLWNSATFRYDKELMARYKYPLPPSTPRISSPTFPPTQQFGVSLEFIASNYQVCAHQVNSIWTLGAIISLKKCTMFLYW